jgi:hypothetical protein
MLLQSLSSVTTTRVGTREQSGTRRALFVHPDGRALGAVKAALATTARACDLVVALDAPGAQQALEGGPFDVVISGREVQGGPRQGFLDRVRLRWPHLAHIRLCNLTEQERAWQPVAGGACLLSRPSLEHALVAALSRAFALPQVLDNPALAAVVKRIRNQPSVSGRLTSVQQFQRLLSGGASSPLAEQARGFSLSRLQQQALLSARIARRLLTGASSEQAYLAALLANVGRVALALAMPEAFAQVRRACEAGEDPLDAERRAFDVTHPEVGAWLLVSWGVPRGIVEAVAFHRQPSRLQPRWFRVVVAVHVAATLTEYVLGFAPHRGPLLDGALLRQLGLESAIGQWIRLADQEANLPESAAPS